MTFSDALTFFNVVVVIHVIFILQEMRKCETLTFVNVPVVLDVVLQEMRKYGTHVFQCEKT